MTAQFMATLEAQNIIICLICGSIYALYIGLLYSALYCSLTSGNTVVNNVNIPNKCQKTMWLFLSKCILIKTMGDCGAISFYIFIIIYISIYHSNKCEHQYSFTLNVSYY